MENTKSYFIGIYVVLALKNQILRYFVSLNYYRENVVMPSVMTLFLSRSQNCVLSLLIITKTVITSCKAAHTNYTLEVIYCFST